jgi:hypothetical protein
MTKFPSSKSNFFKISGLIGGVMFMLFGVTFVYSHGTTPQNRMLPIFGVNQVIVLTIIASVFYICLGITLASLKKFVMETGKLGRYCYGIVLFSYITLLISLILQNIVVDPHTEWDSPISITGWIMQNLSWLSFTVGMVILGILFYKSGTFRHIALLNLLFGVLAILTFLGDLIIYSFSSGSVIWDIIHAAIYFPFGVVWILLAVQISENDPSHF